jgi:non-heme chloroperoxidase
MGTITTDDGTEIFIKDSGEGQPIVFSHGWPLSADDWDTPMLFFLEPGYRVVAHDRRGHGRSSQTATRHEIVPCADSGPLSAQLLPNATLETYEGFPHGMPTTQAETLNPDLLAFLQS